MKADPGTIAHCEQSLGEVAASSPKSDLRQDPLNALEGLDNQTGMTGYRSKPMATTL